MTIYKGSALHNQHRTVSTYVTRETPAGDEMEVPIEIEWSIDGADPSVGIMSAGLEVQAVYLTNEDGERGPMFDWSQTDADEFDDGYAADLMEQAAEDYESDRYDAEESRGDDR